MKTFPTLRSLVVVSACVYAFNFSSQAREDTRLDGERRFKRGDAPGAEQADLDDRDWQGTSLPHNWGFEETQLGKSYYRGPGWYRRELNVGVPKAGRRYFVRFEAASSVADVYLDGKSLGQHHGAFGAFGFEVTSALSARGTNLLAVRVSNAPERDIAPLSGDSSVFGGLYRPPHLIETAERNASHSRTTARPEWRGCRPASAQPRSCSTTPRKSPTAHEEANL